LLYHVRELVGEQLARWRFPENDVRADGIRARVHRLGRTARIVIAMHAHAAEVVPETRLHELARLAIERFSRGPQDVVHEGRRDRRPIRGAGRALEHLPHRVPPIAP
jgi:hypothetical protein